MYGGSAHISYGWLKECISWLNSSIWCENKTKIIFKFYSSNGTLVVEKMPRTLWFYLPKAIIITSITFGEQSWNVLLFLNRCGNLRLGDF